MNYRNAKLFALICAAGTTFGAYAQNEQTPAAGDQTATQPAQSPSANPNVPYSQGGGGAPGASGMAETTANPQNDTRAGLDQGATANANESTVDSRPVPQPTKNPPSADSVSNSGSAASSPPNSESSASLPQPTMNPPSADSVSTELASARSPSSESSASATTQTNDSAAAAVSAQGNGPATSPTPSGTPNPMTASDPSANSQLTNSTPPTPNPVATPSPDATLNSDAMPSRPTRHCRARTRHRRHRRLASCRQQVRPRSIPTLLPAIRSLRHRHRRPTLPWHHPAGLCKRSANSTLAARATLASPTWPLIRFWPATSSAVTSTVMGA